VTGFRLRSLRGWLTAGGSPGRPRPDLLAPALLRAELTETELADIVRVLTVGAGHSIGDPVPDEDIRRVLAQRVFPGADEAEVYRVREAMRRAGRSMVSHS